MQILGKGFEGVVVAGTTGHVQKFYKSKEEWEDEKAHLLFLANIQAHGFEISCTIPKHIKTLPTTTTKIAGETYRYSSVMERVPGFPAKEYDGENPQLWSTELATVIFNLHTKSQPYVTDWVTAFGREDALLRHILEEKAAGALRTENDKDIISAVKQASEYLQTRLPLQTDRQTLSHQDITPSNVLLNEGGSITGLVDWATFGLTHPSLSLYQLAPRLKIWTPFQKQYMQLGGIIDEGILYAAAVIHLAWAPAACKEHGIPLSEDESRERLDQMNGYFKAAIY